MAQIDEASRRWDDFQGGRPITLPDGAVWWFYEPPAVTRGISVGWTFGSGVAPDVDLTLSIRFARVVRKWKHATCDADRACVILEAAWFLLARNYSVTPAEFEAIMAQAQGDEATSLGVELRRLVDEACERAVCKAKEVA